MHLGGRCVRRRRTPCIDGLIHPRPVGAETLRQRLEEGDPRTNGERAVTREDFAGERDAGRFTLAGQKILAQLDEAFGARRSITAPIAGQQRASALGYRLQQFPEKRGVHLGPMALPIR